MWRPSRSDSQYLCCVPPHSPIVGLARHAKVSLLPLHERKKKEMKEKAGTTLSNTQEENPTLVSGVLSGILCRCKCLPTQAKTPKAARLHKRGRSVAPPLRQVLPSTPRRCYSHAAAPPPPSQRWVCCPPFLSHSLPHSHTKATHILALCVSVTSTRKNPSDLESVSEQRTKKSKT